MKNRLIPIKEVAARLGVSVRTVWRMIADGQLPQPVKVRARTMVAEQHVEAIIGGKGVS